MCECAWACTCVRILACVRVQKIKHGKLRNEGGGGELYQTHCESLAECVCVREIERKSVCV